MLTRHRDWMRPKTSNEPFIEYEDSTEGTMFVPADVEDTLPISAVVTERYNGKWFSRLTPDGCFMDSTDWSGPFDSEEEALWHQYDQHGDKDEETFFHFIGNNHMIQEGTLEIRGDHLWGIVLGEFEWKNPRLVHLFQSNGLDREEWEDDEGNVGYDIIEDINDTEWDYLRDDLQHNVGFEIPTGDYAQELLRFVLKAQGKEIADAIESNKV